MFPMPWWFWILLWLVLVNGAIAVLGWLIFRTVLKGADVFEEFMNLSESFSESLDSAVSWQTQKLREKPPVGVVRSVSETLAQYEQSKNIRKQQRISRRIQKRDLLGQPQRVGDLRNNARKGATHG